MLVSDVDSPSWITQNGWEGEKERGVGWGGNGVIGVALGLPAPGGVFGCMGAQLGQAAPERGVGVRLPLKAAALSMYIEYALRKEREPGADGATPNPYSWKWARSFISDCWGTLQARSGPLALHVPEVIQ